MYNVFLCFLFEAKPGMGKTSSMAMLAMKWVKDDKNGEYLASQHQYIRVFPILVLDLAELDELD